MNGQRKRLHGSSFSPCLWPAGSDEAGDDPSDAPEADPDTEESIEDVEAALAAIEEAQQLLQEADSKVDLRCC